MFEFKRCRCLRSAPTPLAQDQNDANLTGGEILENLAISEESKGGIDKPLPHDEYVWVPFDIQTTGFGKTPERYSQSSPGNKS